MAPSNIPHLRSLVMIEGSVFANVEKAAAKKAMEIRLDDASSPFEPCAQNPVYQYAIGREFLLDTADLNQNSHSMPRENTPGEIFACWVNNLTDWALSGSQTVQLMISKYDTPCEIFLNNKITVPKVEKGMFFEAYLGVHRAQADLHVVMNNPETGSQVRHTIAFDLAHPGGASRSGYKAVRLPIPSDFKSCDVKISVQYHEHVPDNRGTEPFVFLADVHVATAMENGKNDLLEADFLYGDTTETNGTWFKSSLPNVLGGGENLSFKMGDKSYPVRDVEQIDFRVRENYGHTLICESGQEMDMVLCIDGIPVKRLKIGKHDNIIRIPNQYLNGYDRRVSLRDKSASVVFFEKQQLMPSVITPADILQRETAAPFPTAIFAQTALRYAGLKAVLGAATQETDLTQINYALSVLEGGYENVKLKPLHFPKVDKPDVSIVIPAHNKVEVTYLGLCSLLVAHNKASFEVIVVDDASTDETSELENIVSGITVIHNVEAQRFIRACNAGAEKARGEYIVLLNNDVEVTTGWIDELIAAFSRFDNVGLVGSKLLYPNGELQDAGGIIWGTGNPWNYGNRQNPNEPRFSYARQADYLCGAAMMVPTKLWKELDGLSSYMEPMYFEDTDFAFKVREAGYTTWFVPSSIVYHYEGMTSGTDVSTGFKKYQEVNRPKFKRRWANAYANFGKEGHQPDLEKDRGIVGRVLFIDYATPRMDRDAGSYAAIQEIKLVQSLGYKVSFMPTNMAHFGSYTEELQKMGVEMIYAPFYMNTTEYLNKHAQDFDAFFITRYYVGQAVLQQIRSQAPNAKILFNNADLHFLREIRTAQNEGDAGKLDRARQTRTEELDIIKSVDVVLSYNDVEHSVIQAYTDGQSKVVKCPWVVDVPATIPAIADRKGMSFLGSFKHHPNAEGIIWFTREVMSLISAQKKPIPLTIYGSGINDEIKALKSDLIHPHGFIQDAGDAYDAHRIFVAPLLSGAGIKGKVLSALAHGIPCVLSPTAAEGIGLRSGHDCFIANTPAEWVEAINKLNTDAKLWTKLSENSRSYMQEAFSFDRGRTLMRAAFEEADLFGSLQ